MRHKAVVRQLQLIGRTGVVDDKQPGSVWLFTNHFGAESARGEFGAHTRRRLDNPPTMQHCQPVLRFNDSTCLKCHPTLTRKQVLECLPYALAAGHILSVNHEKRFGLIQGDQSFDIAEVEGLLEKSMYFCWAVCGHPVRPISDTPF
jgi:hypothetical protein